MLRTRPYLATLALFGASVGAGGAKLPPPSPAPWVLEPSAATIITRLLQLDAPLREAPLSAAIDKDRVVVTLGSASAPVARVTLVHPDVGPAGAPQVAGGVLLETPGPAPPGIVKELLARLRRDPQQVIPWRRATRGVGSHAPKGGGAPVVDGAARARVDGLLARAARLRLLGERDKVRQTIAELVSLELNPGDLRRANNLARAVGAQPVNIRHEVGPNPTGTCGGATETAILQLESGDPQTAAQTARAARIRQTDCAEAWRVELRALLHAGRLADATTLAPQALKATPTDAGVRGWAARAWLASGQPQNAAQALWPDEQAYPPEANLGLLALSLSQQTTTASWKARVDALVADDPRAPRPDYLRAAIQLATHDYMASVQYLRRLEPVLDSDPHLHVLLARAELAVGQVDPARLRLELQILRPAPPAAVYRMLGSLVAHEDAKRARQLKEQFGKLKKAGFDLTPQPEPIPPAPSRVPGEGTDGIGPQPSGEPFRSALPWVLLLTAVLGGLVAVRTFSRGRVRRVAGLLSLTVFGIIVGFGILAVLRLEVSPTAQGLEPCAPDDAAYKGIYQRSNDPALVAELRPGANCVVNSDGFLDRSYAVTKPAGTWRIVGLGDSVTMYYTVEGTNYLSQLEERLPTIAGRPVEVLNFGVGGYDTLQEVRSLEVRGLKYSPDFVTVGFVVNDVIDFGQVVDTTLGPHYALKPSDDGLVVQERIRRQVMGPGGMGSHDLFHRIIAPHGPYHRFKGALRRLAFLSRQHGFGVLVILFPAMLRLDDYYLAELHRAVAHEARQHGFGVIDLTPAFQAVGDSKTLRANATDAIHPNAEGNAVAARQVLSWMQRERPWQPVMPGEKP